MKNPPAANAVLERVERAREFLQSRHKEAPRLALVLGSGLGSFADSLDKKVVVPFAEIPGMPQSGVQGHAGNMVFGTCGAVPVVAMQGRVHVYEGHTPEDAVFGLRVMIRLGATEVILTNAAGGANPALEAGDLMLIEDQLNLTGLSPLSGPNVEAFGPRFPDMSEAYSLALLACAEAASAKLGVALRRGVYAGLLGPQYETPSEVRMLHRLGADAVGMSTVLETLAARHMGARVLGISCITNKGAGLSKTHLSHAEVQETANRVRTQFESLLRGVIGEIGSASAKGKA